MTTEKKGIRFHKIDDDVYRVLFGTAVLGVVYRDGNAWSYGNWFIEGEPREKVAGGVNGTALKYLGYVTRTSAANRLAVMQSAVIIASMR